MSNSVHNENIVLLSIFGIIFTIIVFFYADDIHNDVYAMIYTSPIIICVIISLSHSHHYKNSYSFSLAFLFLGLGMLSLLIAETIWVIMPYFQLPQYESYPDIFYFGYVILSLIFPWFILKYYKIHLTVIHYFAILLVIVVGILTYLVLSADTLLSSSFSLGLVFVILSSTLMGISVITLIKLKNTKIFQVWMLIVSSFLISAVSDIWYYANANTQNWAPNDFVNIIWFVSYLILVYALTLQRYSYKIQNQM